MNLLAIAVPCIGLCTVAAAQEPFHDYGVGARVAECRGIATTQTADGRNLVIVNSLDLGPTGWILVTDIDSGQTRQFYYPESIRQSAPFGSLMSSNGKFYTAQGSVLVEFDPSSGEFTYNGRPAATSPYLSFTQDAEGLIWAGGCGAIHLVSFDPQTRETRDHGVMDPAEQYLSYLATDDRGWVYCGIGTARYNIVAYNPTTGEKRQLIDEAERALGTATVYPTVDGKACGIAGGKTLLLHDGTAQVVERAQIAAKANDGFFYWGQSTGTWPDGRAVKVDLPSRYMEVTEADGSKRRIDLDYETEGASVTSLGAGPEDIVYASSCHPMHLLRLDTGERELVDLGPVPRVGGGNFCSITTQQGIVFGAQYAAGGLWYYDPLKPWNPGTAKRQDLRLKSEDLLQAGRMTDGHFTHLKDLDALFFCGDKFGAEGTFTLRAAEAGTYSLYLLPLKSVRYCKVAFSLNGESLGEPYDARAMDTRPGEMLTYGPFDLEPGEHTFTVRLLEQEGQEPWFSLCSLDFTTEHLEAPVPIPTNPDMVAQWKEDICRPRAALAHPDGVHVLMAGFAGYGMCGGGVGIYNMDTGESQLLTAEEHLIPGHSTISLQALPNGDLVGGTSISAPGGGHTVAEEAELWIMDWESKAIIYRVVPVPGDGNINSMLAAPDGLVYGLSSSSTFFVFDPEARQIVHSESYKAYGAVPRHALHSGPDGMIYAMMSKAILRITPGTFAHEKLADAPVGIEAGGALVNGRLCFSHGSHVWTYDIPGL